MTRLWTTGTKCLLMLALAVLASGCAGTTAVPVSRTDTRTQGIRYYEVKPLLVLRTSDKGVASWDVIFVPNYNRGYALQFAAFLAKNDVEAEFSDGGALKKIGSKLDSTAAIDLIKLAAQVATGSPLKSMSPSPGRSAGPQPPAIYEFVFDDEGNLTGLRPLPTCPVRYCGV